MKNIIKIVIVMLTSISMYASAAYAGDLKVTGTAKATYNMRSGHSQNAGQGIGVANEINFIAAGDTALGKWAYKMALDPADGSVAGTGGNALNDDTTLTLAMPTGTIGFFILDGGLSRQNAASQSVYGRPTDIGDPSGVTNSPDIDGYNNIQYHTPAGLLPLGIQGKVAYAPQLDDTNNSGNAAGAVNTKSATNLGDKALMYQVTTTPIAGLTIGADYIEFKNGGTGVAATTAQQQEAGSISASYATGPVKVGYSESRFSSGLGTATVTATPTTAEWYDQDNMSVAFAVNKDLSLSYEVERSEKHMTDKATANVRQKSSAVQAAYTMGGMSLAVSHGSYKNISYTNAANANQTLFAVTMAF